VSGLQSSSIDSFTGLCSQCPFIYYGDVVVVELDVELLVLVVEAAELVLAVELELDVVLEVVVVVE